MKVSTVRLFDIVELIPDSDWDGRGFFAEDRNHPGQFFTSGVDKESMQRDLIDKLGVIFRLIEDYGEDACRQWPDLIRARNGR